MKRYGIARRAPGHGLAHRGLTPPTREKLQVLVHEEHLSYAQIGALYGVDSTAIQHWVRKQGIAPPTIWGTRRKGRNVTLPTADELHVLYDRGYSLEHIGWMHGVSGEPIYRMAKEIGLDVGPAGWNPGRRWTCDDGHTVRSTFEMRVDNWLHVHGVDHQIEPRIPYATMGRADFLAVGWYIEVWGITNRASYRLRQREKREHFRNHQIPLLELERHDFASAIWQQKLTTTLDVEPRIIPA